jgi:glutamate-1-semialdehyde 2,1-aminomutase
MELLARARRLAGVLRDACSAAGFTAQFPVVGTLVGMFFGDGPSPTNFDQAKTTNEAAYSALFRAALTAADGGDRLAFAPGAYEALFVGLAHDDQVIDAIGVAAHQAATVAAREVA